MTLLYLLEREDKTKCISAWAETRAAKPPWEQVGKISLLRNRHPLIPPCLDTNSPASHELQESHRGQALETPLASQPQHCSTTEAGCVGQERGKRQGTHLNTAPAVGEGGTHQLRQAHLHRCPSQNRGNQPRRRRHSLYALFPPLLALISTATRSWK